MTRKRFLKLVMSYEVPRNDAERMAVRVNEFGSYESLFSSLRLETISRKTFAQIRRFNRAVSQRIQKIFKMWREKTI